MFKIMASCRYIYFLLFLVLVSYDAAAQQTVTRQRIKNVSHISYNGDEIMFRDSLQFFFSGERGATFNPFVFESSYVYGNYGYRVTYEPQKLIIENPAEYLHSMKKVEVQYDSAFAYASGINVYSSPWAQHYISYDENYLDTYEYTDNAQHTRQIIHRSDTIPVGYVVERYDTGRQQWNMITDHHFRYDDHNRIISDTIRINGGEYLINYAYASNGEIATVSQYYGSLQGTKQIETTYQYNTENKLSRWWMLVLTSGQSDTNKYVTCAYDPQGRIVAQQEYGGGTLGQNLDIYREYGYNALGGLDKVRKTYFDQNGEKEYVYFTRFYYNSFHNPDSAYTTVESLNGGHLVPDNYRTYYTYETYEVTLPDTTDTSSYIDSSKRLVIYPNPAYGHFKIKWNSKKPNTAVHIQLYAANGQLVRRYFIAKPRDEETINIEGIASELYYIRILTISGGLLYQGTLRAQ